MYFNDYQMLLFCNNAIFVHFKPLFDSKAVLCFSFNYNPSISKSNQVIWWEKPKWKTTDNTTEWLEKPNMNPRVWVHSFTIYINYSINCSRMNLYETHFHETAILLILYSWC